MKKLILPAITAMALFAVSACSDYDNDYSARQIAFEQGFDDMFGKADPNHNWNTAVQNHVTVTMPEGQYTVKMYTENPRYAKSRAYMLGNFENVNGGTSRTFDVDMPGNLGTVYVGLISKNGDRIILPAQINGDKASVSFPKIQETKASTRTIIAPADEKMGHDDTYITWGESAQTWTFGYEDVRAALTTLPEGKNNLGKVSQNLCYVSMGEFTIYPMHYVSNNGGLYGYGDVLGIYYYDNLGTRHDIDIWQRGNDWHKAFVTNVDGAEEYDGVKGNWNCVYPMESTSYYDFVDGVPTGFKSTYKAIRSTGITVNIPVGTKFGFYIGTADNGKSRLYSESALNESQPSHDDVQCYAASFHEDGELFLCFEDWHYMSSGSDRDFNDIVLGFHGSKATPVIVDKDVAVETMSYMVACEDLGTEGAVDFDYNDVVFAIQHASGQSTAKVQLRAAGGTCEAHILYDGTPVMFNDKVAGAGTTSNIHRAFGYANDIMINTKALGGKNADFVLSNEITVDPNAFTVTEDASKFGVYVIYKNGTESSTISIPDLSMGYNTGAQAFLVADPEWIWPLEKQNITSAYPQFTTWVSDHLKLNWYESVWGEINEQKPVPSSATDILTAPGTISYNALGNVATVTIPKSCFTADKAHKLVIKPTSDCNVEFTYNSSTWTTMPTGTVQGGRVTTFTINETASNAVIAGSSDVTVTFTFAAGVNAATAIQTLYWTGAAGGGGSDDPAENDYSEYGTSLSSVLDLNNPNIQYNALVPTSSLPESGDVTITYIYDMADATYVNLQNPTLKAWWFNDTNQYNQYWDNVVIGAPASATTSALINGNPKYATVSFTINATAYAGKTYIGLSTNYANGTVTDVRIK